MAEVRQIIQGKYLVGHAIEHDLLVLEHFGPPFQGIRDTSQYLRWKGKKISLKKAAQHYLQKTIQSGKEPVRLFLRVVPSLNPNVIF